MKLTPQQLDQYYLSLGIHASDLLSAESLRLEELPEGVVLSAAEKASVLGILRQWNDAEDLRQRIDMAQAMERTVLRRPDPVNAWAASLMLGRVRGYEERRDAMRAIARGEAPPIRAKARRTKATPKDPAVRRSQKVKEKLEARGDGETITYYILGPGRG